MERVKELLEHAYQVGFKNGVNSVGKVGPDDIIAHVLKGFEEYFRNVYKPIMLTPTLRAEFNADTGHWKLIEVTPDG